METLPSFGLSLQRGDHLMSWDTKSGYRHFYLHPRMREYFLFRYSGRYYRCVALPFGWGRSVLWFTKLLRPMVKHIRTELGYGLLTWIDDFLCVPSDGNLPATGCDCRRARSKLEVLFAELGLSRHGEGVQERVKEDRTSGCFVGHNRNAGVCHRQEGRAHEEVS
jgi:hypothetical protein